MDREGEIYRESGEAPISGIIRGLVYGLLAAAILTPLYALLIDWNPLIYVNFVASLILGGGIGVCTGIGGQHGKIRNSIIRITTALIVTVTTLYLLWFVKMGLFTEKWDPNPASIWTSMKFVNALGPWSLKGTVAKGGILWIIWLLEAGIITWLIFSVAVGMKKDIFCESCQKWLKPKTYFPLSPIVDPTGLKSQLQQADFSQIEALQPIEDITAGASRIGITHCPDCESMSFIEVTNNTYKMKDGEPEEKAKSIVNNLSLNSARVRGLMEKWNSVEIAEDED